jgi:hypothetical protein
MENLNGEIKNLTCPHYCRYEYECPFACGGRCCLDEIPNNCEDYAIASKFTE